MGTFCIAIEDLCLDVCCEAGSAQTDGRAIVSLSEATALAARGQDVELLVRPDRVLHPFWASRVRLRHVNADHIPDCRVDGRPYDLTIVNHWSAIERLGDCPILYQPHESESLRCERLGRGDPAAIELQETLMRRAVGVLLPSRAMQRWVCARHGLCPEKVFLAWHGVDTQVFRPKDPRSVRERTGLDGVVPLVLFVGPLEQRKGLHVLTDAFERLSEDIQLVIVGDRPKYASADDDDTCTTLKRWAGSAARSKRVTLLGARPWFDLPYYYSAAHVAVFPSLMEPFGLPAIEALACGTPVVASAIDGLREVVRPARDGLLTSPGDSAALADAINQITTTPSWSSSVARNLRASHAGTFTWDRAAITIESVIERAVPERPQTEVAGYTGVGLDADSTRPATR